MVHSARRQIEVIAQCPSHVTISGPTPAISGLGVTGEPLTSTPTAQQFTDIVHFSPGRRVPARASTGKRQQSGKLEGPITTRSHPPAPAQSPRIVKQN